MGQYVGSGVIIVAVKEMVLKMGTRIDMETVRGRYGEEIRAIARQMHMHPELGLEEHETTALIRGHMQRLGIEEIDIGLTNAGVFLLRGGDAPP
jgi:metal-dependent amidase/aminoacylase/carboxypeptidase family protein